MNKLIFIFLLMLCLGCKKENPNYSFEQEGIAQEGLTFEEDSVIASQPFQVLTPSDIIFPDGETLRDFILRTDPSSLPHWGMRPLAVDYYKRFYQGLSSFGNFLSNDNTMHDEEPSEILPKTDGIDILKDENGNQIPTRYFKPAHRGYGYAWNGSERLDIRKAAGKCDKLIYGIDCSGMATLMFRHDEMTLDRVNADKFAQEDFLNKALSTLTYFSDFPMAYQDVGQTINIDNLINGDVIYFKHKKNGKIFHVGIAIQTQTGTMIYQSNGDNDLSNFKRGDNGFYILTEISRGCEYFSHVDNRGPHPVSPKKMIAWGKDFANWGVLHLVPKATDPKLFGNWKVNRFTFSEVTLAGIVTISDANVADGLHQSLLINPNNTFTYTDDSEQSNNCSGSFYSYGETKKVFKVISCGISNISNWKILNLTEHELTLSGSITQDRKTQNYLIIASK